MHTQTLNHSSEHLLGNELPQVFVDKQGSVDTLFDHIDQAIHNGAKSLCILACDENDFDTQQALIDEKLKALPIPVFGGIFPQIIADAENLEKGSLVLALPLEVSTYYVEHLSDPDEDYYDQIEQWSDHINVHSSLITLVDGLSSRISAVLEDLYDILGSDYQYIGGGAGSLSFRQKPCLFSNDGLRQDCAQITKINEPIDLGIKHGWQPFAGPFFITGANHTAIQTLDYRPAFEVYQEVVEKDSGKSFQDTDFFDLAKAYPFGLDRLKGDVVVRDPLYRQEDELICVGEVPSNHMVYILKGDAEQLLAASKQSAETAVCAKTDYHFAILFDCISRVLFLEDRFQEEIGNIKTQLPNALPLIGVLSLGEIADAGNACLEFFNKTIVLGSVVKHREAS